MAPRPRKRSTKRAEWVNVEQGVVDWEVDLLVETIDGVVQPVGLLLQPPSDAKDLSDYVITWEKLHALPLRELKERAAKKFAGDPIDLKPPILAKEGRALPRAHYEWVATAYETAVEANSAPIPFIAGYWEVSRSTAARWIARARELDLLDYPEKPGIAGFSREEPLRRPKRDR